MEVNENTKITLTIGQLKTLVNEAYAPQYVKDAVYEACNEIDTFIGYLDEDARMAFKKFKEILDRTW